MSGGNPSAMGRDLGRLFESGSLTGLTDRDLIETFFNSREGAAEAAFEAILSRHGPMVLRVCRNALGDPSDAEDAFQATFLVLVKQRSAIRKLDSVASWLYGVAVRVSAKARTQAARRRKTETRAIRIAPISTVISLDDPAKAVVSEVVQEAVSHLPENYRSVVLLCYWEGLTHEQAAARLGCPIGTVRSRIARAKGLLHRRLSRQGFDAYAQALAVAMARPLAAPLPSLSADLIRTSAHAAANLAAGRALAEVVSANVALLARHVTWSLFMTKISLAGALAACLGLATLASGYVAPRSIDDKNDAKNTEPAPKQESKVVFETKRRDPPPEYVIEPPDLLLVEVLEALPGRPINGERLVRPDGKISLGFYGEVYVAGLTITEAKEKIVLHLKRYLNEDTLGLLDKEGIGRVEISPRDTDRVFVDVTAYNSKYYFVLGEVAAPGRFPTTGNDTILDAINYAGGLTAKANPKVVTLFRKNPDGPQAIEKTINLSRMMLTADGSENYQLQSGDRLVVHRVADAEEPSSPDKQRASTGSPEIDNMNEHIRMDRQTSPANRFGRSATPAKNVYKAPSEPTTLDSLDRRLSSMEEKLEQILGRLEQMNR